MAKSDFIYKGTDGEFEIDLGDLVFDDLADMLVGFKVNDQLLKLCRKTATGINTIEPVTGEPAKCVCRIFRDETAKWPAGILMMEITTIATSAGFPDGIHTLAEAEAATIKDFLTATR